MPDQYDISQVQGLSESQVPNDWRKRAGSPRGLARAMEKLDTAPARSRCRPVNAQRNMFIVEPLTGKKVASLFMTHPSVEDRVRRLIGMERS